MNYLNCLRWPTIFAIALSSPSLYAAKALPRHAKEIPYIKCFIEASAKYSVELPLLVAIAEKESGFNPLAYNASNRDGSFDIGIMQINSYWIKGAYKKGHFVEPCFNIHFGAYVLSDSVRQWGYNWKGVGKYNARSPEKGYIYTKDLYPRYVKYVNIFSHAKN